LLSAAINILRGFSTSAWVAITEKMANFLPHAPRHLSFLESGMLRMIHLMAKPSVFRNVMGLRIDVADELQVFNIYIRHSMLVVNIISSGAQIAKPTTQMATLERVWASPQTNTLLTTKVVAAYKIVNQGHLDVPKFHHPLFSMMTLIHAAP